MRPPLVLTAASTLRQFGCLVRDEKAAAATQRPSPGRAGVCGLSYPTAGRGTDRIVIARALGVRAPTFRNKRLPSMFFVTGREIVALPDLLLNAECTPEIVLTAPGTRLTETIALRTYLPRMSRSVTSTRMRVVTPRLLGEVTDACDSKSNRL